MGLFGINKAIESVQREIYNSEYSFTKNELRANSSTVFVIFENVIKELFHIYSYFLYGENYEEKLRYLFKRKKLMLGDVIEYSRKLNDEICKVDDTERLKEDIGRDYFIFDGKDNNYKKSKEIASIRGKIIHDDIYEIKNLQEYKNKIHYAMNLCKEVLQDFRDNNIFPRLLEYNSITEGNGILVISFIDEIGSILPANLTSKSNRSLMNNQVYIFKGKNKDRIIPAKIKIDYLHNISIESKYIELDTEDDGIEKQYLYLKISDRQDIIPLLPGKRSLGRNIENDIIFKYRSISRRQCIFEVIEEGIFVVDLDSTFGTRVNGIKIEPFRRWPLFENDEIAIGEKKETIVITVTK